MNPLRRRIQTAMQTRGGAAAFSPASIPGLKLWLDASQIVGLNDGDSVGTWSDTSGNANDATQATVSAKPTYKTSIQNGLPVVRFDGVDDVMTVAAVSAQPMTFFLVGKTSSTGRYFFDGVSGNRFVLGDGLNGPPNNMGIFAGSAIESSFTISGSSFNLWTGVANGVSSSLLKNGAAFASGDVGSQGLSGGMTLGNRYSDPGYCLNGDLAELIIYNTSLSIANRQLVEAYLRAKWATP